MSEHVVTVIQARTESTRLPRKVLYSLGGRSVLQFLIERVAMARRAGTIVIATTTNDSDSPIVAQAVNAGVAWFRGHPTDLLDRHYQLARALGADHVVKIPSDCPLIDPDIIDAVIGTYLDADGVLDYASNLHPPTHPDGNDVEIMSFPALECAWRGARQAFEREHTTPFIWDQPDRFHLGNVRWGGGRNCSATHRVVLDFPEDYSVIRRVVEGLEPANSRFSAGDVVAWLDAHPEVAGLNAHYRGVHWYNRHRVELRSLQLAELS